MKRESIKEFALITIGIFLVAISVVYFFEPNNNWEVLKGFKQ